MCIRDRFIVVRRLSLIADALSHVSLAGIAASSVSYTHLTLPTMVYQCRSRWWPDH
ncbi:metal ABC transporter permease, partial [Bacillus pumilus]|uniref:metal ABC transporter permease n=1 Tax=Bacillus pumilus TaxID=1408 RepID=UPI0021C2C408